MAGPVDLVVERDSSDTEIERRDEYRAELLDTLTFRDQPETVLVAHHLAHLCSAFFPSPFADAAVVVIDAQGS